MVSILVVSHSFTLAKGVKEIGKMISDDVVIEDVGGLADGSLGTDYQRIKERLESIYTDDGVIIFADMGSSIMTVTMVLEELNYQKVVIADCPIVEGIVKAVMDIIQGKKIDEIELDWENCILHKA